MRHRLGGTIYKSSISRVRLRALCILLIGLILPQLIIYAPSFFDGKVLLPLDFMGRLYGVENIVVHDLVLSDQVTSFEPWRKFSADEAREGRWPLWYPYTFAGVPFCFPGFSPYHLVYILWPSPHSLVWIQLLKTLVAGLGCYLFLRKALNVGFWSSAIVSWCLPLTGFYTVWLGYYASHSATLLPWILLATHAAFTWTRRARGLLALACATGLCLTCGQIDIALQSLIISGIYALWLVVGSGVKRIGSILRAMLVPLSAWLLGFMLAAPYLLPMFEYIPTGMRMIERAQGVEARPPVGLAAFPQMLIPDFYGTSQAGSVYFGAVNIPESAASGFVGILVTLFLVPLGWLNRQRRREYIFWLVVVLFTVGWTFNIPGVPAFLRLPILNMMSHNRFVFASSFALLVLCSFGLEVLQKWWADSTSQPLVSLKIKEHRWFAIPVVVLVGTLIWCLWLWQHPPAQIFEMKKSEDQLEGILGSFRAVYLTGAAFCVFGLIGWCFVFMGIRMHRWSGPFLLTVMLMEYLRFAGPFNPQTDPALYYPDRPMLDFLAKQSGRVIAVRDWPPNILAMHHLRDVRGYDGVDPARLIEVMRLGEHPDYRSKQKSALTMYYVPAFNFIDSGQVRLLAPLNMLNVRWLIFRGAVLPGAQPVIRDGSYWVVENPGALSRVFIPHNVHSLTDDKKTLELIGSEDFNPRETAYLNGSETAAGVRGKAEIQSEVPDEITIHASMETPGVVVIADQWYPGWRAWVNGHETKVHRINHVLRGVFLPAGNSIISYRYAPFSFTIGLILMFSAGAILLLTQFISRRLNTSSTESQAA